MPQHTEDMSPLSVRGLVDNMECYFYDEHGYKCDLSEIVSNTRVFFGRNQPFLCVEVDVPKQTFESREYWEGRIFDSQGAVVHMSDYTGTPAIIYSAAGNNGARAILYIDTYGGKYDYLEVTQQAQIDDFTYRFICYSKTYRLKSINLEAIVKAGNGGGEIVWYNSAPDGTPIPMSYRTDNNPCDGAVTVVYGGDTYTQVWRADDPTVTGLDFPPLAESKGNPPNSSRSGRDLKCSLDEARFFIPIYSNPSIVPSDENYKQNTSYVQGMRYDTVYASVLIKYAFMISKGKKYYPYVNYEGKDRYVHAPAVLQDYDEVAGENVILSENDTRHFGFLSMDKDIEAIWGSPDAIFSWIAEVYGGYSSEDEKVVIEDGRYFPQFLQASPSAPVILTSIWKTTATSQELQEASSSDSPFTGFVCFSAKTGAWEALEALGLYTSRYPYFGDKAYFTSFIANADNPEASKSVDISYSAMDIPTVNVTDYNDQSRNLNLGDDLENDDQGVTYQVVAGLKYSCNSTSGGIPISLSDYDSDSRQNGISNNVLKWFDIEYTPPRIYGSQTRSKFYTNEYRAGAMGWNAMLRGYCSSTAITLSVYEAAVAPIEVTYDAVMESEDLDADGLPLHPESDTWYVRNTPDRDDNNYKYINNAWVGTIPSVGDTTRVTSAYGIFYMTYGSTGWENSTSFLNTGADFKNASFAPNAVIETLNNHRANWTSYNIPVACVTYSWPSMLTSYFLSDSPFTDTESTIAELQESMAQAVKIEELSEAMNTTGNLDISITTKPLVSGQFADNAYSGIKIQRDASKGVANIDGYSGGQRQVRFSSEGSVSCGTVIYQNASTLADEEAGDSVIMDRSGFTTRLWVPNPTTADTFPFVRGTWVEQTHIGTDGFITAGAGYIRMGADGLSTFDDDNVDEDGNKLPVYNLSNEGLTYKGRPVIDTSTGMISMRTDSAFVEGNLSAISITLPYVQIDDKGLRTFSKYYADVNNDGKVQGYYYDGDDLQCAVGTNGIIVAGAGAVKLDASGLTTWSGVRPIHVEGDASTIDDAGFFDYSDAVKQCAVTVDGELIAGANLYKLDKNGLSYNFGSYALPDWEKLLTYNVVKDRVELYPSIYVKSAQIDSISADKITTGKLSASTSIYVGTGADALVLGLLDDTTYGLSGNGFRLNQNGLNLTEGVVSLGNQVVLDSAGLTGTGFTLNGSGLNLTSGNVSLGNGVVLNNAGLSGSGFSLTSSGLSLTSGSINLTNALLDANGLLTGNAVQGWAWLDATGIRVYTRGNNPQIDSTRKPVLQTTPGTGLVIQGGTSGSSANQGVQINLGAWNTASASSSIHLTKNAALYAGPVCAEYVAGTNGDPYYAVKLSDDGLHTYSYTWDADPSHSGYAVNVVPTEQCYVGTDGMIVAGEGAVKLGVDGLATYDVTDPSSPVGPQCTVSTNGAITAGQNLVKITGSGMTLGSTVNGQSTVISMSAGSYVNIVKKDGTSAVLLSDTESSFADRVVFDDAPQMKKGLKVGTGGRVAPGLAVLSDGTNTANFEALVLSPSLGNVSVGSGTYGSRLYDISPTAFASICTPTGEMVLRDNINSLYDGSGVSIVRLFQLAPALAGGDSQSNLLYMGSPSTTRSSEWPEVFTNIQTRTFLYDFTPTDDNANGVLNTFPLDSNTPVSNYVDIFLGVEWGAATSGEMTSLLEVMIEYYLSPISANNQIVKQVMKYETIADTLSITPTVGSGYLQFGVSPSTITPETYDQSKEYAVGDICWYMGSVYFATQAGTDHTPQSSPTYWTPFLSQVVPAPIPVYLAGIRNVTIRQKFSLANLIRLKGFTFKGYAGYSAGDMCLSQGGVFGQTFVPTSISGTTVTGVTYPNSPIVNANYASAREDTMYLTGKRLSTTSSPTLMSSSSGIKNIYFISGTSSTVPTGGYDGDICIVYDNS